MELQRFLKNPTAKKYLSASWDRVENHTANFYYPRIGFIDALRQNTGSVTLIVVVGIWGLT
ncbi:hypothetical protein BTN49_1254 [Candidatus Enterovibrio escicola]|uniref:Peptidase S54 GlpG peptidase N-terminal domain-containing protein n=1 Tax=Candidatus Enterovibrio escicola TaxID=1927127 RepID=A0A2A5T539_9GAMM|nr:hypothetical protein BTN49_1254 [Candidatus Enterovibrio escacola]